MTVKRITLDNSNIIVKYKNKLIIPTSDLAIL